MTYTLVKGDFHLFYKTTKHIGSQPDGDSVWFKPDNPNLLKNLGNRNAKFNKGGCTQLRFEAIDALELHYDGANHQLLNFSKAARDFTLKELGFKKVDFTGSSKLTVKSANPHPVKGYILTRSIDPYGRPVSFVFAGTTDLLNGSQVFLDVKLLGKSVNAGLAEYGNAYPTFYSGLPTDLRNYIIILSDYAIKNNRGFWPDDKSSGAVVTGLADLANLAIWPKLYRRLVSYFKGNNQGLAGFDPWLRAKPAERDDAIWIISKGESGNLHDVIKVKNNTIGLRYSPKDMIITPR